MPAFIAAFLGGLINITGSIVGRVFVALGFGVVSYTGVNSSLTWLRQQALTSISALPPEVIGMLSTMRVGHCISIVTSAIVARSIINGVQSDTVKKWVIK